MKSTILPAGWHEGTLALWQTKADFGLKLKVHRGEFFVYYEVTFNINTVAL